MHLVLVCSVTKRLNNIKQNTKIFHHEKSTTSKNFKSTSLITRRKDQQRFSEINSGYRTSVWLSVCHLLLFCCFACFFFSIEVWHLHRRARFICLCWVSVMQADRLRGVIIIQYFDTYHDPELRLPVFLMELLDEGLTQFLEWAQESLPYHTEVNLCYDIALALFCLHSHGIGCCSCNYY